MHCRHESLKTKDGTFSWLFKMKESKLWRNFFFLNAHLPFLLSQTAVSGLLCHNHQLSPSPSLMWQVSEREKSQDYWSCFKVNVKHTMQQNKKITYSKNNNWSVSFCFFWPHGFFVKQDRHDFNKFLLIHTLSLCTYITVPISFGKYTMIPLYMCFISCFYFLRMHPIRMHHTKHAKDIWMITMQYMYFQNTREKHSYHIEIHKNKRTLKNTTIQKLPHYALDITLSSTEAWCMCELFIKTF